MRKLLFTCLLAMFIMTACQQGEQVNRADKKTNQQGGADQIASSNDKETEQEKPSEEIEHDKILESEGGEDLQLPDDYPENLPIIEGATIIEYTAIETKSNRRDYIIVYEVYQSLEEVEGFIHSYASEQNWQIEDVQGNDEMFALDLLIENEETPFELIQVDSSVVKGEKVIISLNIIADRKSVQK